MRHAIGRFAIEALKPATLETAALPEPAFLADPAAWEQLFEFAARVHATLPLVATLSRVPWFSKVPEPARLHIERKLRRERIVLALLDEELDASVSLLLEARIPVAVLKGMDLGRRYYSRRIHRPMTDVDLLVPPDAFSSALGALGRGGFRVAGPFPEGRFRVELARREGGPVVELHKHLLKGDTDHAIASLWGRLQENVLPGLPRAVRALGPEDNLVYLVRHGAVQHLLETPVWLNDLHFLVESEDFLRSADWDRVVATLARERALAGAWLAFTLLAAEWGTHVPAEALRSLGQPLGALRRRALSRLARPEAWFPIGGRSRSWIIRSRFLLRDSAVEAIRYGMSPERTRLRTPPE